MRVLRKDYTPLPDELLDGLKAKVLPILGTLGCLNLPAKTIYWLVMEVIDSREEIFRLRLCETVEQILAEELDDEEDLLAFRWPDDPYLACDMETGEVLKPTSSSHETARVSRPLEMPAPSPEQDGRRMPRAD